MSKEEAKRKIAQEIQNTIYDYHYLPHMGMIPDFFIRYWDLAEAVCEYFEVPFDKPKLTTDEDLEEYMNPVK